MNAPPNSPRLRLAEDGLEKFCAGCSEWWPADRACFSPSALGAAGLHSECKACAAERNRVRRARERREVAA